MAVYLKTFTKDPSEVLPYPINWAPWLIGSDTIVAAVSTPDNSGITVNSTTFTTTSTTPTLSSGVAGTDYRVAVHVTTAGGLQGERTILVKVRDR